MRKQLGIGILVTLIITVLCSCGENQGEIHKEFQQMVEQKATPQHMVKVRAYLDDHLSKLDQDQAEQMMMGYEDYLLQYVNVDAEEGISSLLSPYYDSELGTVDAEKIQEPETRELCQALEKSGIRFSMKEERILLSVNYQELIDEYGKAVGPALSGLYQLKETEFNQPVSDNAVLMISWSQLAERAYSVEQLIAENKEDQLIRDDAKWMYENYLGIMLMGMNNTPIFDFTTADFSQEADDAYTAFIAGHPDSSTADILREYAKYLDAVGYRMDYKDKAQSKEFFDQCSRLVSEAGKRVYE